MSATTHRFTSAATAATEESAGAGSARGEDRNLQNALATWCTIGVAVGVLVERYKITLGAAFARLVDASQHRNVRLRERPQA